MPLAKSTYRYRRVRCRSCWNNKRIFRVYYCILNCIVATPRSVHFKSHKRSMRQKWNKNGELCVFWIFLLSSYRVITMKLVLSLPVSPVVRLQLCIVNRCNCILRQLISILLKLSFAVQQMNAANSKVLYERTDHFLSLVFVSFFATFHIVAVWHGRIWPFFCLISNGWNLTWRSDRKT